MRGVSDPFGLRLDDEKMVVVLAVTLAVVLVAITIVVVVFACIRSTDRRRTCVTSSSTAILSNVMSLKSAENKHPPSLTVTLAPRNGHDRKRDKDVIADSCHGPHVNGSAKLNGTTMATSAAFVTDNGNTVRSAVNGDGWKQGAVVRQACAASDVENETSVSQVSQFVRTYCY